MVKYHPGVEHFSRRKEKFKKLLCHDSDEGNNKGNVKRRVVCEKTVEWERDRLEFNS